MLCIAALRVTTVVREREAFRRRCEFGFLCLCFFVEPSDKPIRPSSLAQDSFEPLCRLFWTLWLFLLLIAFIITAGPLGVFKDGEGVVDLDNVVEVVVFEVFNAPVSLLLTETAF